MVTMAPRTTDWERASYLDLEGNMRAPQAIAALLPQVLARYSLPASELDERAELSESQRTDRKATAA